MLTTFLFTFGILFICMVLLCIKILLKKNGKFPNTHIEGNAALRKQGICCARTQDKKDHERKDLYERLNEIKK